MSLESARVWLVSVIVVLSTLACNGEEFSADPGSAGLAGAARYREDAGSAAGRAGSSPLSSAGGNDGISSAGGQNVGGSAADGGASVGAAGRSMATEGGSAGTPGQSPGTGGTAGVAGSPADIGGSTAAGGTHAGGAGHSGSGGSEDGGTGGTHSAGSVAGAAGSSSAGSGGSAGMVDSSAGTAGDSAAASGGSIGQGGSSAGGDTGAGGGTAGSTASSGGTAEGGSSAGAAGSSAGAGGAGAEPPVVSSTLAEGCFNVPYTERLSASGGTGLGYVFALDGGTLPPGLTLTADGTVSGTPTADGSFTFAVRVTDSGGLSSTAELSLSLCRKRWVAYRSTDRSLGHFHLFLIDIATPLFPKVDVTADMQPDGDVGNWLVFSPDGNKLAYTADSTVDGRSDLYVVGLEGTSVGAAQLIATGADLGNGAWSPSGSSLAFRSSDGTTNSAWVVEFEGTTAAVPVRVGQSTNSLHTVTWLNEDRLIYLVSDQFFLVTRQGSSFGSAQQLNVPSCPSVSTIDPSSARVSCSMGTTTHSGIDLETGETMSWGTEKVSYDLGYVGASGTDIINLWSFQDRAAGLGPSLTVDAPGLSGGSNRFTFGRATERLTYNDGDGLTWLVDPSEATPSPGLVDGLPLNANEHYFIGDDTWLLSTNGRGLYASPILEASEGSSALTVVSSLPGATDQISLHSAELARHRPLLAHGGPLLTAGIHELFMTDLGTSPVSGPTRISPEPNAHFLYAIVGTWTADDAAVVYEVTWSDGAGGSREELYMADMTEGTPSPQRLFTPSSICQGGLCPEINGIAAQP